MGNRLRRRIGIGLTDVARIVEPDAAKFRTGALEHPLNLRDAPHPEFQPQRHRRARLIGASPFMESARAWPKR
jgi:hypothetical protein